MAPGAISKALTKIQASHISLTSALKATLGLTVIVIRCELYSEQARRDGHMRRAQQGDQNDVQCIGINVVEYPYNAVYGNA